MPMVSHRTAFPNELLHDIVLRVVATSIHTICVSPDDVEWEMNVLSTLCRVSFNFRTITLELARRAFQSKPEEGLHTVLPPFVKQMERLRVFGLRLHRPAEKHASYFEPLQEDSLLIFGYSLFLSAMSLRYNSSDASPQAFETTHEIIISALSASLVICLKVEPPGMGDVLSDIMCMEMDLVRSGLDIVRAALQLDRLMRGAPIKMPLHYPEAAKEEEDPIAKRRLQLTLTRIHEEVEKIEKAEVIYASVIASDKIFVPKKLPGVIPVLKRLREFEGSEPSITDRVDTLLDQGSAFVPFRDCYVPS
ncbi:hypothetical protein DXG03_005753 [Asterophora parasitica]|uniref:Uncharacterized protein n=1 Tax=Asterophora parasitica TaxID=117018 RepID=A0A9P7K9K8_9AGAR|nr:hypothetical protein DXG03_005753 [Asterophora parasitica]